MSKDIKLVNFSSKDYNNIHKIIDKYNDLRLSMQMDVDEIKPWLVLDISISRFFSVRYYHIHETQKMIILERIDD